MVLTTLIELPVLLLFYSTLLCNPVNVDFIIYRTCYVSMGFPRADCEKLGTGSNDTAVKMLEKHVQPKANLILMASVILDQIIPPILCLFIGPWSDRRGRTPVMIASLTGRVGVHLTKVLISLFPMISPWYMLLESIPNILSGGFSAFLMVSICYVTDSTSVENRGLRMGIFEVFISLGILLGTISSSYLFKATSYTGVFLVGTLLLCVGLLYTALFIRESIDTNNYVNSQEKSHLLSTKHIKDMLKATFRQRMKYGRPIILLLVSTATLYILAINNGDAKFLFLRYKFDWSVETYTIYSSVHSSLWILGTVMGVYVLHKMLATSEPVLLIIGYSSMAASTFMEGLAFADWQIYFAAWIQCMGAVITPMTRSLISKVVDGNEIGKIFALIVAMEAFAAILSNTFNSLIYNSTIDIFPGAFNFYGTIIYTITALLSIVILMLRNKQRLLEMYEDMDGQAEEIK